MLALIAMLVTAAPGASASDPAGDPAVHQPAFAPSPVAAISPPEQGFYSKLTWYAGIPIKSHASVSDEALFAAREQLETLLAHAPEIRANLAAAHHELHVIGKWQFTSDLPEHRASRGTHFDTGQLFDDHMRGGHITGRLSSCTEGSLLKFVGDVHFGEEACLHELGHAVELLALSKPVRARIGLLYQWAVRASLWGGHYAAKNESEYFAELTRYYFTKDHQNEHVSPALGRGRSWLQLQDPDGFRFVDDLYSGRISPGNVVLVSVDAQPAAMEHKLRSRESTVPSSLTFLNHTASPFRVVWIDFEGHRDTRLPFDQAPLVSAGNEFTVYTYATHVWIAAALDGTALCTAVAPRDDGRVDVNKPCQ